MPVPRPGPGELLLRLEATSVCGTDLHIYHWDAWAQGRLGDALPRVFGHETAGRVVARGPGATRVPLGSLVGVETHLVDWACRQCLSGRADVCSDMKILGVDTHGAFAEYLVIPEANAWISDGLSPEVAALQEPMGNAVHAIFVEEIAGRSVAVLGCGPIGLMAVAIARRAGASTVVATDVNPARRAMAHDLGADVVLDGSGDVVSAIRAMTRGNGVDVVLEMSGAPTAIDQAFAAVANGGRISLLGLPLRPVTLDLNNAIIFKGIRVHGITGRRMFETWRRSRALLDEGLDLSSLITHRLPLTRFKEAFELVAEGHASKVVLLPQEG